MDSTTAKKIGSRQAIKAVTAGLLVAYLMMAVIASDIAWIVEFGYAYLLLFSILVIYSITFLFGRLAGVAILIKNRPDMLTGMFCGFLIVWISTFLSGLLSFFSEGISISKGFSNSSWKEAFFDYVCKPLELITMFGFIPTLLAGLWLGYSIKLKGKKTK
jgi:hypothetical protein